MNYIPLKDETCILHTLGNHCNGTQFINRNNLISMEMDISFNKLMESVDGVEYGRFDIKVNAIDDLESFKNLKIIEFNGLAAEPIHIYDSSVGYFNALRVIYKQWQFLDNISIYKKNNSVRPATFIKVINKIWRR